MSFSYKSQGYEHTEQERKDLGLVAVAVRVSQGRLNKTILFSIEGEFYKFSAKFAAELGEALLAASKEAMQDDS